MNEMKGRKNSFAKVSMVNVVGYHGNWGKRGKYGGLPRQPR